MKSVHNFETCLSESHAAHDLPLWEQMYKQAFPTMVGMFCHRDDGEHQRAGIDRSVVLSSAKHLLIDEKIRGRNKITGKVYDDIAIEYLSNDRTGAPGWAVKPLLADYIAYAIAPLGKGYLLPVLQLQLAWSRHSEQWMATCKKITADNGSYHTLSCAVPVPALFAAMGGALRVGFDPLEL